MMFAENCDDTRNLKLLIQFLFTCVVVLIKRVGL